MIRTQNTPHMGRVRSFSSPLSTVQQEFRMNLLQRLHKIRSQLLVELKKKLIPRPISNATGGK
jgi:hypothetical protein